MVSSVCVCARARLIQVRRPKFPERDKEVHIYIYKRTPLGSDTTPYHLAHYVEKGAAKWCCHAAPGRPPSVPGLSLAPAAPAHHR